MTTKQPALDAQLGYSKVDGQPDVAAVLAGMDATATWPAVRYLRDWEHTRLVPGVGDRVLDVGCGLGDLAIRFAAHVAPTGRVVGVDSSAAMLTVAAERAAAAGLHVDFRAADAAALAEPDESFDVCRSERVLQWLDRPERAVAEMVRVLAPGGRICIADTDWQTLTVDLPDDDVVVAFRAAIRRLRGAPASVGSALFNLCRDAGLVDLDATAATHIWTRWDPDTELAPEGIFPVPPIVRQMIDAGVLDEAIGERFVEQLVDAARAGRFFMSIGMFAVFGRRP
ncbi:methyltransferase domain-containing protein [Phytoactinopolyspora limicola]|uniref:methyltransferase domain-containing protein n=1 Tax=Phytoactinopolyspora limicola TaxID=2715536 RepID=UPI00140D018C|nr:methyltransferase domain-containing protein [Phytoactinopolyspora limicola]